MNDLVTTTANCRRELKRLLKEYNAGKMRELPFRTAVRKVAAEMDAAGKADRKALKDHIAHLLMLKAQQDAREAPERIINSIVHTLKKKRAARLMN